jgi:Fe-S cluster biogenesis protein NfuA
LIAPHGGHFDLLEVAEGVAVIHMDGARVAVV